MSILGIMRRLKLIPLVKTVLLPVFKERAMWFPTFDSDVHNMIMRINDYHRFATIGLAIQRIQTDQIKGSLAEAGVYKGDTSRIIHLLAPDKPLFLFDTFEGFPEHLTASEKPDSRFSDTSVDLVLERIGSGSNIIIRKGIAPDSYAGLEDEQFSFVLLDLDLYEPTVASLEFFYPRLTPGGYLMVHDYNSQESNWACKRALDEFMKDKPEKIIEIADINGSAIFRKL